MKKMSEPIVFFGSGPVAAESLRLLAENFTIEAVITKPRPINYHGKVPVIEESSRLGLKHYEAADRVALDLMFTKINLTSRLAVLVDFGVIISKDIINFFPLGILNSHFSLLPEWRGADPITFSILSGQKKTGVSLMVLVAKMDEGPLIAQKAVKISAGETTPSLTAKLIKVSNRLFSETLPGYAAGKVRPYPQDKTIRATYSRKLTKEDGRLSWEKSAVELEREIRAFILWPKSYTKLGNIDVTITAAHTANVSGAPGVARIIDKQLLVCTSKGDALVIDKLKPAGKQEMDIAAFLAGYRQFIDF